MLRKSLNKDSKIPILCNMRDTGFGIDLYVQLDSVFGNLEN